MAACCGSIAHLAAAIVVLLMIAPMLWLAWRSGARFSRFFRGFDSERPRLRINADERPKPTAMWTRS